MRHPLRSLPVPAPPAARAVPAHRGGGGPHGCRNGTEYGAGRRAARTGARPRGSPQGHRSAHGPARRRGREAEGEERDADAPVREDRQRHLRTQDAPVQGCQQRVARHHSEAAEGQHLRLQAAGGGNLLQREREPRRPQGGTQQSDGAQPPHHRGDQQPYLRPAGQQQGTGRLGRNDTRHHSRKFPICRKASTIRHRPT